MKIAIYARVSTNNGQDPELQLRELRDYCQRRNWQIGQEYVDVGISGAKEKRPELDKLLGDAHRRRFDAVVVWRFDRFARSVSHLLRALESFRSQGIEFISLSEQVDTSTPTGKMVFTERPSEGPETWPAQEDFERRYCSASAQRGGFLEGDRAEIRGKCRYRLSRRF